MVIENQRENVATACAQLAPLAEAHELLISHGNGPQIGLLALEEAAYTEVEDYPLDVLGAETQGMIGYLVGQEMGNRLPEEKPIATLLTMIEVDPADPAFADPSKPIGPVYTADQAAALAAQQGWQFRLDGDAHRRVVPSPRPKRIFEIRQIRWLLEHGCVVICAGGGGIPTKYGPDHKLVGVEAVIDKDHASGLLAREVHADVFAMATDAAAVYLGFGTPDQRPIVAAHPEAVLEHRDEFAAGSMLPKVEAAAEYAQATGATAAIGTLADIGGLVAGTAGTRISTAVEGVVLGDPTPTSTSTD
jgi:carbamate kinase